MRRIDTFDRVCYTAKAKTLKRTLLQTDNFFQFSDKKATCPVQKHMNILGISEKLRIKLDNSVNFLKKKLFLHLKATTFFIFHFTVLKDCDALNSNSVSFSPSCFLQSTNSCFTSLKRYRTGTFKPCSTPPKTTGFSSVIYIKLW